MYSAEYKLEYETILHLAVLSIVQVVENQKIQIQFADEEESENEIQFNFVLVDLVKIINQELLLNDNNNDLKQLTAGFYKNLEDQYTNHLVVQLQFVLNILFS